MTEIESNSSNENVSEESASEEVVAETTSDAPVEDASIEDVPLTLEEQLAQAINEKHFAEDRVARIQAEMDNFRKRTQKEVEENRKFQSLNIVRSLLPIMDNLQRALAAAESATKIDDLKMGVEMVAKQFDGMLEQNAVQKIEALHQTFDPNLHEALQQMPSEEHPPMTILQELEPGYTLHDRVVRPAKVIVSQ